MRCTALLRRGFALLRPRMSGAGVAFPVQFISSPRHSSSELCFSSALPGNPVPMQSLAIARPCSPLPLPFCANPARCGAWAGVAFPMQIPAHLCLSSTGLCFSGALRVQALPQLCFSRHILSFAGPSFSGAERRAAIPGHFITLRCPALPSLSERCHCHVLLCPRAAGPVKSLRFRR